MISHVRHIKTDSIADAWWMANKLFPDDYMKDDNATINSGYAVYRSTSPRGYFNYICDLGNRLELNLDYKQATDGITTIDIMYC